VIACGVCRTDLHIVEGDLAPIRPHVVPGHQIVGEVVEGATEELPMGTRAGVSWIGGVDGDCWYCTHSMENLCDHPVFTGYTMDGGYAEFAAVRADFAYPVPEELDAIHVAPLLCAGIIGFRAIRRARVEPGATVGLYGFGGSAHIAIQVLKHWGCKVFVMSRGGLHRELANELGADWIGDAGQKPPAMLDSAILFAPAGELVPHALEALGPGGVLAIAGIHLSDIPSLNYARHIFGERELRSVTANTRSDGEEFLEIAASIPVRTKTMTLPLTEATRALVMLKHDELKGAAVLKID
jgi:propanol-preferring alcohol dehydrogenase